ncbi:MAG TPA: spermidine/putrescine ABC transporter substrate-binding protein [Acidobacteriota bacterium]|nr:spermidine/putrescine ABC transporter substrate-binding protein [Acidobacteriota bacterium]
MKIRHLLLLLPFICWIPAGCSRKTPELKIYTWADYFKPELLQRFERERGCKIIIDTFESNESMYAKIKAGATGYDLLTPSSYFVKIMAKQGYLQPLDHVQLPNLKHVDADYLKIAMDPQMHFSVPYMLTNTGIAYRKDRIKDFTPSWKMFNQAALKGRMTMLNDMRETIGAALKYLGYSLNSRNDRELEAARDVVISWKKNLAKFESEQYKGGIASGEFLLVHGYSGDLLQVRKENPEIDFVIPVEGTSISCDDLVIPKDSKQVRLAHAFINFIHDPDVAAENTNFLSFVCPNTPSYLKVDPVLRNNPAVFPAPDVKARCEVIDDLGADTAKYNRIWDQIKAAE